MGRERKGGSPRFAPKDAAAGLGRVPHCKPPGDGCSLPPINAPGMQQGETPAAASLLQHQAAPGPFAGTFCAHTVPRSPRPSAKFRLPCFCIALNTARHLPAEPRLASAQQRAGLRQPSCRTQPRVFLLIIKPNCNRGREQCAAAPSRWPALPQVTGKRERRKRREEENRSAGSGQITAGRRTGARPRGMPPPPIARCLAQPFSPKLAILMVN